MCKQCEINPVYEFTNQRKLCGNCFIRYFQKKFLYTIRKFGMIHNGEIIGYHSDGSFRDVVLEENLKMFSQRADISLVKIIGKTKENAVKIAVSDTLDSESWEIMNVLIKKNLKNIQKKAVNGNTIRPLYLFLDEEILLYAKLRKMKFKAEKKKENKLENFINLLEKKHPEIKRAIVNSYLKISY